MAQAVERRRHSLVQEHGLVPRVIASVLATAAVSACAALYLSMAAEGTGDFRAAALGAALTALTSFVGAAVIVSVTHRMMPGLWGYVPGFLGVLAAGLWLSEAALADCSGASWWVGTLVALNPLFWVPIYAGVVLVVRWRR